MPKQGVHLLSSGYWLEFWRGILDAAMRSAVDVVGIIVVYLLLRWLLFRVIGGVLSRILAREAHLHGAADERIGRLQTLRALCSSIVGYLLVFLFGVLLFKALGFDIMPFVTTAGVVGLAIGFGAQKLVKDVISGFFIIVDDLFVIGDYISIGDVTGRVSEMGMRVTRVLDASSRLHQFSNGDIGVVTNLSRNTVSDGIEIIVAPDTDLNRLVQVVGEAGKKLLESETSQLEGMPAVVGITGFTAAGVTIKVSVATKQANLPAELMRVRQAMRETLLLAGIKLA